MIYVNNNVNHHIRVHQITTLVRSKVGAYSQSNVKRPYLYPLLSEYRPNAVTEGTDPFSDVMDIHNNSFTSMSKISVLGQEFG